MKLAIGSAQFGMNYGVVNEHGQTNPEELDKILRTALIEGINTIDTAVDYGESESLLGQRDLSQFQLISKIPSFPSDKICYKEWAQNQVLQSLERLNIKSLNALLLHRPNQLLGSNGDQIFHALNTLKTNGLVSKIGISVYSINELDMLLKKYSFDIVQLPFNILDRRFLDANWIKHLKELDIEIHVRSVFLQGLLLKNLNEIPPEFMKWKSIWINWHKWLDESKITAIEACLAFPMSFKEIDKVIVGVDNFFQFSEIITSLKHSNLNTFPDFSVHDSQLLDPSQWNNL
jgi:aryl-alcohol dehydrogenase-like predicted oxidoreductase